MSLPAPLIITIRRQNNLALYDLAEIEPLIQNIHIEIDDNIIDHLTSELKNITDSVNKSYFMPEETLSGAQFVEQAASKLRRVGRVIFEQLFPYPIQKALGDRSPLNVFFRLEDSLVEVPWELAFDGEEFLAKRFPIGRQVITSRPFFRATDKYHSFKSNNPLRLLIVSDPTESLPAASEETESIADCLDHEKHLEIEIIGGSRASKLEVLSALSEFEIVHFAGHSIFDPADSRKTGWLLHDAILTSEEISNVSNPPLLVFSNSCQSAAVQRWDRSEFLGQASLGIGSSFLLAGVRNYIGALWVIHDSSSAKFACAFYAHLLRKNTIGEALFRAKMDNFRPTSFEALTASGYVHYGRPDDVLVDHAPDKLKYARGNYHKRVDANHELPNQFHLKLKVFASVFLILAFMVVASVIFHPFGSYTEDGLFPEYRRAVEQYSKGEIPQALSTFQHLSKRDDNPAGLGFGDLAEIYLEAGSAEKARQTLNDAFDKAISNTMTYLLKGHLAFQEGNLHEAEKAYTHAAALDNGLPDQSAEAYSALGLIYFIDGKKENALEFFNKALAKQQGNPEALFNLGFFSYLDNAEIRAKDKITTLLGNNQNDEMAQMFLELLSEGVGFEGLKPPSPNEQGEVFMIGPFYLGGGTIKRLGSDLLFARLLGKMLAMSGLSHRYTLRTTTSMDFPKFNLKETDKEADRMAMERMLRGVFLPLRIRTTVYGKLELFRHVVYADVKTMDVTSGAITRSISIKAEGPRKFHELAEQLKDELAGSNTSQEPRK